MTVKLLAEMYLAHAQKEYNGQYGYKEAATIRHSVWPMCSMYGDLEPRHVGPLNLRAVRQYWVEQQLARTTIQARMQRLRKMWRWGRQVGLIDCELPDIGHLRYGHCPEPEKVKPVDIALVEATLARVSPRARVLLKLMLYTGMRPGEVCAMRADEIDSSVNPWVFRPKAHKTAWRGKEREIYLGPKAQMLLNHAIVAGQRIGSTASAHNCSSATTAGVATSTALAPSPMFQTTRGNPWTPNRLYMQIFNACRKHDLPMWTPYQLRHTFATMMRKEWGVDAAQVALGHSKLRMTEHYAVPQVELARQAIAATG